MGKIIGIDFGTTNSCVAVVERGKPVVILNRDHHSTTPSVVGFPKGGDTIVGENALKQSALNGNRTIMSVKRNIGTDRMYFIGMNAYTPQEIGGMILYELKRTAENYLGESVTDAVVTVPAYYDDIQRQATKEAGAIAGLNVVRIINEPTAAALAYGLGHGEPQKIMVFDLGGGTFDVSVIEIGYGVLRVLATNGDNHLGGDDFDEKVLDYFMDNVQKQRRFNVRKHPEVVFRLLEATKKAKEKLSENETAYISLPYLISGKDPLHFEYTLTRELFDRLTESLIDRMTEPVQKALIDAQLAASELDRVILVGGSTRIPAVRKKVRQLTGKIPSHDINPDECVAIGAAIQGNALSSADDKQKNNMLLIDVTSLSLSIETSGGIATKLVERNSTLPISCSKVFSTSVAYQRDVEIHILQGEHPLAKYNKTIGVVHLDGIRSAPAGEIGRAHV